MKYNILIKYVRCVTIGVYMSFRFKIIQVVRSCTLVSTLSKVFFLLHFVVTFLSLVLMREIRLHLFCQITLFMYTCKGYLSSIVYIFKITCTLTLNNKY